MISNIYNYIIRRNKKNFLITYPKSGTTWLRYLIGVSIAKKGITYDELKHICPDVHQDLLCVCEKTFLYSSHGQFDKKFNKHKVLYIVRDPRSVAISMYYHCINLGYFQEREHSIDWYVKDVFCKTDINPFGLWIDHVIPWIMSRHPNLLLMKYEDLTANLYESLLKILVFFECEISRENLVSTVNCATKSSMKKNLFQGVGHSEKDDFSKLIRQSRNESLENGCEDSTYSLFLEKHSKAMEILHYT